MSDATSSRLATRPPPLPRSWSTSPAGCRCLARCNPASSSRRERATRSPRPSRPPQRRCWPAPGRPIPPEIVATYTSTAGVTQRTADEARRVVNAAGATDPYHEARALADYLRTDPRFTYRTVAALPSDPNRDLVDFFLFDPLGQVGYCEYFATTMAVMARTLGLPARVAVGYAPGERVKDGVYQVPRTQRSRVGGDLFPRLWLADLRGDQVDRSAGACPGVGCRATGQSTAGRQLRSGEGFLEGKNLGEVSTLPSFEPVDGGFEPGDQRPADESRLNNAWFFVALLVLLMAFVGWRLLRGRRRFRFLAPGDRQWQRLAFAADRAGVAQRAWETAIRVRRLAGGADPAAQPRDPRDRRRQGLAELLRPLDLVRGDRPPGACLGPAPAAAPVAGPPPPDSLAPGRGGS